LSNKKIVKKTCWRRFRWTNCVRARDARWNISRYRFYGYRGVANPWL